MAGSGVLRCILAGINTLFWYSFSCRSNFNSASASASLTLPLMGTALALLSIAVWLSFPAARVSHPPLRGPVKLRRNFDKKESATRAFNRFLRVYKRCALTSINHIPPVVCALWIKSTKLWQHQPYAVNCPYWSLPVWAFYWCTVTTYVSFNCHALVPHNGVKSGEIKFLMKACFKSKQLKSCCSVTLSALSVKPETLFGGIDWVTPSY